MAKITVSEYADWLLTVKKNNKLMEHQRVGQFFISTYGQILDIGADPDLFYEKDEGKAYAMIEAKYVEM